jgi:methylthioribose-1-phosphate isomerase
VRPLKGLEQHEPAATEVHQEPDVEQEISSEELKEKIMAAAKAAYEEEVDRNEKLGKDGRKIGIQVGIILRDLYTNLP